MFKFKVNKGELQEFVLGNSLISIDPSKINFQKILKEYINSVYKKLASKHRGKFTYTGSPANPQFKNLRQRSGGLLSALQMAKYSNYDGQKGEAGFSLPTKHYLWTHEGSRNPNATVIRPKNKKFLTIPLKAALNSDGTPKKFTARDYAGRNGDGNTFKIDSYENLKAKGNFAGTNKIKGNPLLIYKVIGRTTVPYFILAKKVTIRKRLFIGQAMKEQENYLVDLALRELQKAAENVTKKSYRR